LVFFGDVGKQTRNHERFRSDDKCAQRQQQDANIHLEHSFHGSTCCANKKAKKNMQGFTF
jgi:hypothetical protein